MTPFKTKKWLQCLLFSAGRPLNSAEIPLNEEIFEANKLLFRVFPSHVTNFLHYHIAQKPKSSPQSVFCRCMKAYISISYQRRRSLNTAITAIMGVLEEHQIEPFVFVDHYKFEETHEDEMMRSALAELDQCDLIIAETSHKGIGIGIEAGYAKAKNKPVIYLRHKEAEHSTTLSGLSDHRVIYKSAEDLQQQLALIIKEIVASVESVIVSTTHSH